MLSGLKKYTHKYMYIMVDGFAEWKKYLQRIYYSMKALVSKKMDRLTQATIAVTRKLSVKHNSTQDYPLSQGSKDFMQEEDYCLQ